jgi:hypothetical protein
MSLFLSKQKKSQVRWPFTIERPVQLGLNVCQSFSIHNLDGGMLTAAKSVELHTTEIALENCAENCTSISAGKQ